MKRKLVYVEWLDHCSEDGGEWIDIEKAVNSAPAICETVGWLIKETKQTISLAASITHDDASTEVGGHMLILKANITSRKVLEL